MNFINTALQEIFEALEAWKTRTDVSITSASNGTTYDRYDPSRGLHKPYEAKKYYGFKTSHYGKAYRTDNIDRKRPYYDSLVRAGRKRARQEEGRRRPWLIIQI